VLLALVLLFLLFSSTGVWLVVDSSDAAETSPVAARLVESVPESPNPASNESAQETHNGPHAGQDGAGPPPELSAFAQPETKSPTRPVRAEPENPNEFRLDYRIRAFLVDDLGNPIEGASVMIAAQLFREGDSKPASRPWVMLGRSDSRGLVDSKSRIEVFGEGMGGLTGTASLVGVKDGYFPDEPFEVELANGSWNVEEPITIRMSAGGAVRGVLLDENGQPVTKGHLFIHSSSAVPNGRGEFLIEGVKPGEHELQYTQLGYKPIRTVTVRSRVTEDVGTVLLARTNTIMLSVVDDGGPIKGEWEVVLTDEAGRVAQKVVRMTEPSGWIQSIPAATYRIEIRKVGYESATREHVTLGEFETLPLIEIKLQRTGQERGELTMKR
jgi:hypothetical protein